MRLAIMQPYFFPYLGYLALIKHTDHFVVFDTPQFIRHGWIERNRILKHQEGWQYIKVPLEKHKRETAIKDVRIKNTADWKRKIIAQLNHYKKKANYYREVMDLLEEVFNFETDSIVKLDVFALEKVLEYLRIDFKYSIFSEMNLKVKKPQSPDEWALNITKAMEADEYINLPGGKDFFDKNKYEKEGIALKFLNINLPEYDQKRKLFEPGLSIIDVMMFNSPQNINNMLDNYELT
ncbi:MAG: WbqC family protein [Thiohalospira sp.]